MIINQDTIIKDCDINIDVRQKSSDVVLPLSNEDKTTLEQLYKYVVDSTDPEIAEKDNLRPAVGIAAIQIGIPKKMIAVVCDVEDKNGDVVHHEYALANPKIISSSVQLAALKNGEGCLSVLDEHQGLVYRSARIKVKGYDLLQNKEITIRANDYLAIVLQHEIDHFDGVLFYDHIDTKEPFAIKENAIIIE